MRNWKLFIGIFFILSVYSVGINLYADSWPTFSNSGSGDWSTGYYRTITITNSAGAQIDYQVAITPFTDTSFIDNTGLVGSWHFSEGSGAATADMSGNGNNGTLIDTTRIVGKFGNALSFDGTNSVDVPNSTNLNITDKITLEAWVKPQAYFDVWDNHIVNKEWNAYMLYYNATGIPGICVYVDGGMRQCNGGLASLDTWTHIIGTYDSATREIKIYTNGTLNNTITLVDLASYTIGTNGNNIRIGSYSTPDHGVNGSIDEVRIYNRALSEAEITARYNYYTTKLKGDYSDIRFSSDQAGLNELNYWQETDNKFWVKVPSLPPGDSNIYMYYGNVLATDSSDGDNTFLFFDDFTGSNGSAVDNTKWDVTGNGGSMTIQNNQAYLSSIGGTLITCALKNSISLPHIVEVDFLGVGDTADTMSRPLAANAYQYYYNKGVYNEFYISRWNGASWDIGATLDFNAFPYSLRFSKTGTETCFYYGANGNEANTLKYTDVGAPATGSNLYCQWDGEGYWDTFRVRKYVSSEPTVSVSDTEQLSPNCIKMTNPTSLVSGVSAVKTGQSIAYISFDMQLKNDADPDQTAAYWKRFRIDKYLGLTPTTTPVPNNKIEIQVWCEKNGNGFFDVGDQLVSKGQFQEDLCEQGTSSIWLNMKRYQITIVPETFYIVFKLANDIGGGQRASVRVKNSSYMEFDNTPVGNENF